jgi:hypothetical protein
MSQHASHPGREEVNVGLERASVEAILLVQKARNAHLDAIDAHLLEQIPVFLLFL